MKAQRPRALSTSESIATTLTAVLDLIALGALASTFEVHAASFGAAALIFLLGRLTGWKPPAKALIGGFAAIILGALSVMSWGRVYPVVVVAHAVPLAHALLWFRGPAATRFRSWRIGLGLAELILAAVLTSDVFLPAAIVTFIVLAAVTASCNFLDSELRTQAPDHRHDPLPAGFVRRSVGYALFAFLSSALIFPLLPRLDSNGGLGNWLPGSGTSVGYTEGVDISRWQALRNDRTGSTVLRLYPSGNGSVDLLTDVYGGLLRGRVLERFDGKDWRPGSQPLVDAAQLEQIDRGGGRFDPKFRADPVTIEIVREPLGSEVLPLPYGTRRVTVDNGELPHFPRTLRSGERVEPFAQDGRIRYFAELVPDDLSYLAGWREVDGPRAVNLEVPAKVRTERMEKLARRLFAGARNEGQKVAAVQDFFARGGFSGPSDDALFQARPADGFSPLEEFLFVTKEGHCEWFASAAALLLRLGGVPTRLIAGFRLSRGPIGGVLSVRSGEAHAWVEAWIPTRGWIPLDATPRLSMGASLLEGALDAYDYVSAYWYKYVVSYQSIGATLAHPGTRARFENSGRRITRWVRQGGQRLIQYRRQIAWGLAATALILGLFGLALWQWAPWVFSIRWKVHEGPLALRRARTRMETFLRRHRSGPVSDSRPPDFQDAATQLGERYGSAASAVALRWTDRYLRARFGPSPCSRGDLQALGELHRDLRRIVTIERGRTSEVRGKSAG